MASTGVCLLGIPPIRQPLANVSSSPRISRPNLNPRSSTRGIAAISKHGDRDAVAMNPYSNPEQAQEEEDRKGLMDFIEEVREMMRSSSEGGDGGGGGGPPCWFSPLECGARDPLSPLLLFLPGIDGTGLGLIRHHRKLGKIFDIWCLNIPVMDRTPVQELVKLVEDTVRSQRQRSANRPVYIVGESVGACLALDVAARNPDIDLVLILANPATSSDTLTLRVLMSLLELMPDELPAPIQNMLSFKTGDPLRLATDTLVKGFPLPQTVLKLPECIVAMPSYLSILPGLLPKETLLWKLQMLKSASASASSTLHVVKAQTMLVFGGKHQNQEEVKRLCDGLPKCGVRWLDRNGYFFLLEDDFDLVTLIKENNLYRRGKHHDFVSDYLPPTPLEFKKMYDAYRWLFLATSPVILSTREDGKVVKSLAGIPREGPVLYVGNHLLIALDASVMITQFLKEENIRLRLMGHPVFFTEFCTELPELQAFGILRMMGFVPSTGSELYRQLSSKSHVLMYPGGVREAFHRKGEVHKLFWPEHAEFVRMAARFGAKIVPFGAVGEDDLCEVIFDYNDQTNIPYLKALIEETTNKITNVRIGEEGEIGNQDWHLPGFLPKIPGRFYFYFGKPIETSGRSEELMNDKAKARELYLQIKSEVERCIEYLKEKREVDPYRSLLPRMIYSAKQCLSSAIPTFEL